MSDVTEEVESEEVDTEETETEETETVESLKAKLAEAAKALEKANRERARLGKKVKEAPKPTDTPVLTDAAKKAFVVAELKLKGLDDTQARKFSKLVDFNDIDLDDDGDVTGIDLSEIEEDFPELFNKTTEPVKKPVRKVATGDRSNSASIPTGWSDVTKKMLGRNA